jgi:hypothetical protein
MIRPGLRSVLIALTIGITSLSNQVIAQTDSTSQTPINLFGNEGLGIGSLSLGGTIPASSGYSHPTLAQGFTVGATPYELTSVDLGLVIASGPTPDLDIALYSSVLISGNQVPGDRLGSFDSTPTNNGGVFTLNTRTLYNFAYAGTNKTLDRNTSYWIVVSYTPQQSGAPTFYWQFASGRATDTPVQKNESGFAYLGTLGQHEFGADWENHGNSSAFPNSGIRIGVNGVNVPTVNPDGGGDGNPDPTCFAKSKGFFKNKFPEGWPQSILDAESMQIGGVWYDLNQLRTMLKTNSTKGNQIGQLASQVVAVRLSIELYGVAPGSEEQIDCLEVAESLLAPVMGFDQSGKLTGTLKGVSNLIECLDDGYIKAFHCDDSAGTDAGTTGDDDDDHCGKKKISNKKRDHKKAHDRK